MAQGRGELLQASGEAVEDSREESRLVEKHRELDRLEGSLSWRGQDDRVAHDDRKCRETHRRGEHSPSSVPQEHHDHA